MRAARSTVVILGAVLISACSSSGAKSSPSATTTKQRSVVRVTTADNGQTVDLAPGQELDLALDNTYWQIAQSAAPTIVREVGRPVTTPNISGCVPGGGCGTVRANYIGIAPGTADITASRTTCGEARPCTGSDGSYRVTVVVAG
jgi:hypothetical protein